MADPRLEPQVLSEDERRTLENWVRRRSTAQGLALRARIVLACAEGRSNVAVAARLGVDRRTVRKWRTRFLRERLDGLTDDPRPGVPRTITDAQAEEVVVVRTLEEVPAVATHCSKWSWPAGWAFPVQRAADLARIRAAALADRDVQDLSRPAAD
jgi:transposase-like protein